MNEQTTYSLEAEQRRTLSPLTVVGQQVRLTLGRLISPPVELDVATAVDGPTAGVDADVKQFERTARHAAARAA